MKMEKIVCVSIAGIIVVYTLMYFGICALSALSLWFGTAIYLLRDIND